MIYSQLAQLLSVPPGDLVYHLVVLFAIEAILMMAIAEGRRSNWTSSALRLVLASGGLLVARIALVIIALLSAADLINSAWITPPLERFVAIISLVLIAWAFLPVVDDFPQTGLVLTAFIVTASAIVYGIQAQQWYIIAQDATRFFNATQADWGWNVAAVALASLAVIATPFRRRGEWGMLMAALGLLLAGHALHLFAAEMQSHVAGWVRVADLCAYPLLAGLMLHRAAQHEEPSAPPTPIPWAAIEVCQRVADAINTNVALQRAGVAISNILGADVLAIGLLNEAGDTVELGAVCRTGMPARSGPSFDLESQLPVQSAVNRQRGVMVGADQEAQRATLAALVGGTLGPLWVQPLTYQRVTMGVLIAGRAHAPGGWTTSEVQTLNGLCNVLASALSTARKGAALSRQVDELSQVVRSRERQLAETQTEEQRKSLPPKPPPPAPTRPVEGAPKAPTPAVSATGDRGPFLEAVKRLQQISDAHTRLVAASNDRDALFALYRGANSLKEMSAAMGYVTLAKIAGTLAESLQRFRDSQQPMTTELLGLIGESAAALKTLLADAQADRSPSLDITPLLRRFESPVERSAPLRRPSISHATTATPRPSVASTSNGHTLTAQVQLAPRTPLKVTRAMMILTQIKRMGQIVACQPVEADLRSGGFEDRFTVTFTTSSDAEAVRAILASIQDVTNVIVE